MRRLYDRKRRRATLYLFITMLGLLETAGAFAQGQVEIRVTDHQAGIGNFLALKISVTEVQLHKLGEKRGEGWVPVLRGSRPVDIVPLKDGKWESIGVARVPHGRYDAIRVRARAQEIRYMAGREFPLHALDTTLASPLEVKKDVKSAVIVDFYVEDQTEHLPPRYMLKLRRVSRIPDDERGVSGGRPASLGRGPPGTESHWR